MVFRKLVLPLLLAYYCTAETINNKRFPKDFFWSCSTAAAQIEGAWNEDGKSESMWDYINHIQPSQIVDNSTADVACDSYHKYKEDVAALVALGATHYRFSIAWTRILPSGYNDTVNPLGVAYYKKLIAELKANNIEPLVTMIHIDIPESLIAIGGIWNDKFPYWFEDYARVLFNEFGNDVKYWFTINEPHPLCMHAQADMAYFCAANLIRGHAMVWHLYDREYREKQNGKVSIVLSSRWSEPESNSADDIIAAETARQFTWGLFAHPLYYGDFPAVVKSRVNMRSQLEGLNQSRLAEFNPAEIEFIKGTTDFFSANIYATGLVRAIDEPEIGTPSIEKDIGVYAYTNDSIQNDPLGNRKLVNWLKKEYFDPEILITENGIQDQTGQVDDGYRTDYLKRHLSAFRDAMVYDGVKIIGYSHWSLMDNMEWNSGYTVKFGLYSIDFKNDANLTRVRKESSYYYEKVIRTGCLVDECVD
ncbi:unnamed protein product [Diabrotica balteata]|uniref:Myrosinase 1-like n=1 Tax=Diabrotica balteata TaxID=107213 RepID=A0A9N9SZ68_DIABA|nr:unnamed protein product [Diabrotica balteata]